MRVPPRVPTRALARTALVAVVTVGIAAVPAAAWSSPRGASSHGTVGVRSEKSAEKAGTGRKSSEKSGRKPGDTRGPKHDAPGRPGRAA